MFYFFNSRSVKIDGVHKLVLFEDLVYLSYLSKFYYLGTRIRIIQHL